VPAAARTVSASMDREWLDDQARHDPALHAYALWDLDYAPESVEFRVVREGGVPVAYLLIWRGQPVPTVHWVGADPSGLLLAALPSRPLVAVVPEPEGTRVAAARGPVTLYRVRLMTRPAGAAPAVSRHGPVRRLDRSDLDALRRFAASADDWVRRAYLRSPLEPGATAPGSVWGAFDGSELVGVAATHVQLPRIWVLGGIYVEPRHRGLGLGRALTAAAVAAADGAGAHSALYVRDDNAPALRAYESVGFSTTAYRTWVDAGANRAP
jgi:ribosomal protein S18 acetylase RimI-like enzyme